MDSFTSMKTKTDALGLYRIEEGTNIYAELMAYADGIDLLFDKLDIMLRELFIDTAEDYGISCREMLLGREKDDYTLEQRREMLVIYEQMMGGKCTPNAFEMILRGYGLSDFTITEVPGRSKVSININDSVTESQRAYISKRADADFPSHLNIVLRYNNDPIIESD